MGKSQYPKSIDYRWQVLPEGNDSVRWEKASIQSREFAYRIQIIEYEGGIFEPEGGEYGKNGIFRTNTGHIE